MHTPDQIITWGGQIVTYRWDNSPNVDIKDFSVREIQVSTQPTMENNNFMKPSGQPFT